MFGELKQFTKHLHKTSCNILDFFAKNRTSKLQTELGEEGRMVLFRSNHFASQKRTSHTAKSDLFQLHKLQPPCYFSTYLSFFSNKENSNWMQVLGPRELQVFVSDWFCIVQSYIRQLYVILCIVVLDKSKHPCAKVQPHQDGEKVLRDTQGHVTPMARDT